jgi:N,N'-diacetyllegionaminate synthase
VKLKIFNKYLKKENPVYFIAEIGVNHGGSLKLAKKMILAAKSANANAVKFQTFKTDQFVTKKTSKVNYQKENTSSKESHYEMIKSLELSEKAHEILMNFCKKINIDFLSTPYNIESAKYLTKLGCKVFKTSSADLVDLELHTYLAKNKKTVIISTGMSNLEEIEECLKIYKKYKNNKFILLHCVSNYPCKKKSLNMLSIKTLEEKFKCLVGYSDHSVDHYASMTSIALGAVIIEKHFTINKNLPGPDQKTSSLPSEFKLMVNVARDIKIILGSNKKNCQKEEIQMKNISRKSLTLNRSVKAGEIIKKEFVNLKRPGTGLYFKYLSKVVGRKAIKNLKKDYQLSLKDIKK